MLSLLALLACTNPPDEGACIQETSDGFCPHVLVADEIQDFYLELSDATLAALNEDYTTWESRQPDERKPYHPIETFRWGCQEITNAQIRLKGNPQYSWQGDKLQFVVAFQKEDDRGRFQGLRKLAFDAPFYDPTLLSERLAFAAFEDMGVTASCANHARLHVNGELYGVYTILEVIDKEYLQRRYGDDDDGNLYKFDYGAAQMQLRTNEEEGDTSDYEALMQVDTYEGVEAAFDLDQAMPVWAAESIVLQADGYWAGSLNFALYDHPTRGWLVLPWDMDHAFDFWPTNLDPLRRQDFYGLSPHLDLTLADIDGHLRFIDTVKERYAAYDVGATLDRLDTWADALEPELLHDPNLPFSISEHRSAVIELEEAILERDAYLGQWVQEH